MSTQNFQALNDEQLQATHAKTLTALQMAATMGGAIAAADKERLAALEAELSRRKLAKKTLGPDVFGTRSI